MMIWLKRYQNVRIGIADGSGVVVREIDAAGGHADVVEDPGKLIRGDLSANVAFDLIHVTGCFLNARAGLGPNMKEELPRIHGWERSPGQATVPGEGSTGRRAGSQLTKILRCSRHWLSRRVYPAWK